MLTLQASAARSGTAFSAVPASGGKPLLAKRESVMQLTELERMLFEMDDDKAGEVAPTQAATSSVQPVVNQIKMAASKSSPSSSINE